MTTKRKRSDRAAYCLDCGAWTERAKDGTLVIRHDPTCPTRPR